MKQRTVAVIWLSLFTGMMAVYSDPLASIDRFKRQLSGIATVSATVDRRQLYRDERQLGHGTVVFSSSEGTVYHWKSPGRYLLRRTTEGLCGINLKKRTGWRLSSRRCTAGFTEKVDPLDRLFHLRYAPEMSFTFRGTVDSLLFYTQKLPGGRSRTIGLEAVSFRCSIIESFSPENKLLSKVRFYYSDDDDTTAFPAAMVITETVGNSIAIDSLQFRKVKINRKPRRDVFLLPDGIAWRNWSEAAPLPDHIDTVPHP